MASLNQRSFSPTLDFNNVPDADNLNVKGLVTVPLYSGGRNAAGRESARANSGSGAPRRPKRFAMRSAGRNLNPLRSVNEHEKSIRKHPKVLRDAAFGSEPRTSSRFRRPAQSR